jgi:hypothetical protein
MPGRPDRVAFRPDRRKSKRWKEMMTVIIIIIIDIAFTGGVCGISEITRHYRNDMTFGQLFKL